MSTDPEALSLLSSFPGSAFPIRRRQTSGAEPSVKEACNGHLARICPEFLAPG